MFMQITDKSQFVRGIDIFTECAIPCSHCIFINFGEVPSDEAVKRVTLILVLVCAAASVSVTIDIFRRLRDLSNLV